MMRAYVVILARLARSGSYWCVKARTLGCEWYQRLIPARESRMID
jgi:hypothetical protein